MENILLVFGGVSYEHDISVVTAFQIYKKSRLKDKKLVLFYISRDGKYYICNEKKISITQFSKSRFNPKNKAIREVVFVSGEKGKLFAKTRFGLKEILETKTAIFACHGGDGENGRLVTIFENNGIGTSAGSSDALAVCMDKFLFKSFSKGNNIPVVAGFKLLKKDLENEKFLKMRLGKMRFPVIIKINSGGSSIGLFVAKNMEEFTAKTTEAFEFEDELIIEKFIENTREFNVAVLGDKTKYEISDVDEPLKKNEVLSFADKYLSGGSVKGKSKRGTMENSLRKKPDGMSDLNLLKMKSIAEKIFLLLGLRGVVRVDFLYDTLNDKIYVCEVNTIPGSLAFYFFSKNRIVCNDLIENLIRISNESFCQNQPKFEYMVDVLNENNSSNWWIIFFILRKLFCKKNGLMYN